MQLVTLAVCLIPLVSQAEDGFHEITLQRYDSIAPYEGFSDDIRHEPYVYMAYMDTSLDEDAPAAPQGGAASLVIDPGSDDKILVQFDQLNRAIPPASRITSVELRLRSDTADGPPEEGMLRMYRVLLPWRDGGDDSWATTFEERFPGEGEYARPWSEPGAEGVGTDRAAEASLEATLDDLWSEADESLLLTGPGLVADVQYWLDHQHSNYGWLIEAEGLSDTLRLASGDTADVEAHPAVTIRYETDPRDIYTDEGKLREPPAEPDLVISHIERTPRYLRYHDDGVDSYHREPYRRGNPGIMLSPDFADAQKWPEPGDTVTFTAHVVNRSWQPVDGPVGYRWLLNDRVINEGSFEGRLEAWDEAEWAASIDWQWDVDLTDPRQRVLRFEVDPDDRIEEITENNNALDKYIAAKTWKYWVEEGVAEYVRDYPTAWGSYGYEDYLQWHADVWNETYLDKSRFLDFAPDGCVARITLDDYEVVDNGELWGFVHRYHDEPDFYFDGEWGTEWAPPKIRADENLTDEERRDRIDNFLWFQRSRRILLEPSLLHEASHQVLGAYDVYWSNIEWTDPSGEKGSKLRITEGDGRYVTRGDMYPYGGLMGGDDTRPSPEYETATGLYAATHVGGLNANAPYRNGFYGEWQYDLPERCYVRLESMDGVPLRYARVTLWQAGNMSIEDGDLVAEGLVADDRGVLELPRQDSLEETDVTTVTGHTLRKWNPWGRIDVVGTNTTLFLRVEHGDQVDYAFVRVHPFNRAYWQGHEGFYVHPLELAISPIDVDLTTDVAAGADVTTSHDSDAPDALTDGDPLSQWGGGEMASGDWVRLDLGEPREVAVVRLLQSEAYGEFPGRFEILVSAEPELAEADLLATQGPPGFRWAMDNRKDHLRNQPAVRYVTYAASPLRGRYVWIRALEDGRARLSGVQVHGP